MHIIGLTGGIACGKSTVSQELKALGAQIIDGDILSRELTCPGGIALPAIRASFGDDVFAADGTLNRRALADRIFSDDQAREQLDTILQPMIRQLILDGIEECRKSGTAVCVLDMPLLFEKQLETLCDTTWCVSLPEDVQLQRLMARDHLDETAARARLASQMPVSEKTRRSDVVIDNSGDVGALVQRVRTLFREEAAHAE